MCPKDKDGKSAVLWSEILFYGDALATVKLPIYLPK